MTSTRHNALLAGAATTLLLAAAGPADARSRHVDVSPYIQVSQVLSADLSNGGDVLTYTSLAVGVDGTIQSRRAQVTVNYRYERRISETRGVGDDDVHTGLARGNVAITRDISLEAGALATRTRYDGRGIQSDGLPGRTRNVSQVYGAYVGPTVATHAGPVAIGAGYKYGYTKVTSPGTVGLTPGQPPLDYYDDAHSHSAQVSAGIKSGTVLPVGVNVSAAYQREDAGQLDQRFEGKYVRGDMVVPVSRTVAVQGGVGYEKIEISQRDAALAANGTPVTDSRGRYVTAAGSPRRLAYVTDGLIWDAGVIWRPSPRLLLQGRVGHRYNSMTYTGSLAWAMSTRTSLNVGVYDGIESFGRQLTNGLAQLPTSFSTGADPFGIQTASCAFGTSDTSGAGGCLNRVFQSINTANYRARGVDGVLSVNAGPTQFGVGAGYANRRYIAPALGRGFSINNVTDESYYVQLFASRQLTPVSGIDGNLFANYYDSGIAGAPSTFGGGATGSYYHTFGKLGTTASLGIYTAGQDGADSDVTAQALLGMSYRF